ncbi:MAG: hypothetical protein OXF68_16580 [Gammaproteobacteria bacterium]|nr:hypothetical protein [Gammaproteobacteria bacterium]
MPILSLSHGMNFDFKAVRAHGSHDLILLAHRSLAGENLHDRIAEPAELELRQTPTELNLSD